MLFSRHLSKKFGPYLAVLERYLEELNSRYGNIFKELGEIAAKDELLEKLRNDMKNVGKSKETIAKDAAGFIDWKYQISLQIDSLVKDNVVLRFEHNPVSTRDRLKQTKEKLVSLLKIHRKPDSKKKDDFEMGDPNERLTILETTVSALTSTVGELVKQLRITNLAKASTSVKWRGHSKIKRVMKVDDDEKVLVFDDSSAAESDEE
ncbi:hypothetical protein GIB67_035007 [Kingdonia uniflora]|uniref:Uncharacterized protein n=1 Tax=Kingdonia uniflora TaxID=39325 RepID=A0A7J7M3U7_9MAGN|nr:hypothetical protein GIB67_035007 [Kingdonia uniflora]